MPACVVVRRRDAPPGVPTALEAVRGLAWATVTGQGGRTGAVVVEAMPEVARDLAAALGGHYLVEAEIPHDTLGA